VDASTLEGTWEEILQHTDQLAGQHVRVIVLPTPDPAPESLAKLLQHRVGRVCFAPADLSENTETAFADLLIEKHNALNKTL
jgi:hypothetical protein